MGEAVSCHMQLYPGPAGGCPVNLWCLMQEAASEPVVHHPGGILSVVSSFSQAIVKR